MNIQGQLYQDLAQLPPHELAQLLAGVCLRVMMLLRSQVVYLEREEEPEGEDMTELIKFAKPVFDAMTRFDVPPPIEAVIEEAALEAHRLLSLYLLEEKSCG